MQYSTSCGDQRPSMKLPKGTTEFGGELIECE